MIPCITLFTHTQLIVTFVSKYGRAAFMLLYCLLPATYHEVTKSVKLYTISIKYSQGKEIFRRKGNNMWSSFSFMNTEPFI